MDVPKPHPLGEQSRVTVQIEREVPGGWEYTVLVQRDDQQQLHQVRLGWLDHDFWSHGASAPSRVVQVVMEYVLANRALPLPERFDAARVRRWLPLIDSELPSLI